MGKHMTERKKKERKKPLKSHLNQNVKENFSFTALEHTFDDRKFKRKTCLERLAKE